MYNNDIFEYTNPKKMEETTGKVFARLHHMKSILCKTIKSKYSSISFIEVTLLFYFRNSSTLWWKKSSS